jgi:ABC-type glycerol-3-phosphate transport system permease component
MSPTVTIVSPYYLCSSEYYRRDYGNDTSRIDQLENYFTISLLNRKGEDFTLFMLTEYLALGTYFGTEGQLWGEAGVMAVQSMVPIFVIELAVQRHFARGLTLGWVKT